MHRSSCYNISMWCLLLVSNSDTVKWHIFPSSVNCWVCNLRSVQW